MQEPLGFQDYQPANPQNDQWAQANYLDHQLAHPSALVRPPTVPWSSHQQGPLFPPQQSSGFLDRANGFVSIRPGRLDQVLPPVPTDQGFPNRGLFRTPHQQTPRYPPFPLFGINQMADQTMGGRGNLRFGPPPAGNPFPQRPYAPPRLNEFNQQPVQAGILPTPVQPGYGATSGWHPHAPPAGGQKTQGDPRAASWGLGGPEDRMRRDEGYSIRARHAGRDAPFQMGTSVKIETEQASAGAFTDLPHSRLQHTRNGFHPPSFQAPAPNRPDPSQGDTKNKFPLKRNLENEGSGAKLVGGVKRPASRQGGEEKRQRTEAPRVPGWKAKAAEAVDVTDQFALEDVNKDAFKKVVERETDPHRLAQRQKQIDFGKNTLGYERYLELTPRSKRQKGDPITPKIHQVCSKRSWDGQIKKWRRLLHQYDPPVDDEAEFAEEEYLPGYRDNPGAVKEDETGGEQGSEEGGDEEEVVKVEASIFEDDEDEFAGL